VIADLLAEIEFNALIYKVFGLVLK